MILEIKLKRDVVQYEHLYINITFFFVIIMKNNTYDITLNTIFKNIHTFVFIVFKI